MKTLTGMARVLLSSTTCCLLSALAYFLIEHDGIVFITPLTFTLAITLTNIDSVKTDKFKAIILGVMLSLPVFFFSLVFTIGLNQLVGQASIAIMSSVAAVLMYLVCSMYINMRSLKTGIVSTALLPSLALLLAQQVMFLTNEIPALATNPEVFFISWQFLAGLGINIGIWINMKTVPLALARPRRR